MARGEPLVQLATSSLGTVVDARTTRELPLNGRRFTDLALLTPGVTQDPRGLTSASNGDLAFGGIRGYQSSYLVDGADNNNSFFGQARGRYRAPYQFSNEVVQEFRVSSNTYSPELGRAGTAVINVVTKSGSNHLHGSGFFYFRDSELDAVLKSPEVSGRLAEDGVIAMGGTSESFMATIRAEVERWQTFIKRTEIKLE